MLASELAHEMNIVIAKATGCNGVWKPVHVTHEHATEIKSCLDWLLSKAVVENNRTQAEKP